MTFLVTQKNHIVETILNGLGGTKICPFKIGKDLFEYTGWIKKGASVELS